ncbi:unnamed protein product [Calypogeia fissa]
MVLNALVSAPETGKATKSRLAAAASARVVWPLMRPKLTALWHSRYKFTHVQRLSHPEILRERYEYIVNNYVEPMRDVGSQSDLSHFARVCRLLMHMPINIGSSTSPRIPLG